MIVCNNDVVAKQRALFHDGVLSLMSHLRSLTLDLRYHPPQRDEPPNTAVGYKDYGPVVPLFTKDTIARLNPQLRELTIVSWLYGHVWRYDLDLHMRPSYILLQRVAAHLTKLHIRCLFDHQPPQVLSVCHALHDFEWETHSRASWQHNRAYRSCTGYRLAKNYEYRQVDTRAIHGSLQRLALSESHHIEPLLTGWQFPALRDFTVYSLVDVVQLVNCMRYAPYLTSLSLDMIDHNNISLRHLTDVAASQLPSVRNLSLRCDGGGPSSRSLAIILSRVPNLQSLSITRPMFHHICCVCDRATWAIPTTTTAYSCSCNWSGVKLLLFISVVFINDTHGHCYEYRRRHHHHQQWHL